MLWHAMQDSRPNDGWAFQAGRSGVATGRSSVGTCLLGAPTMAPCYSANSFGPPFTKQRAIAYFHFVSPLYHHQEPLSSLLSYDVIKGRF